MKLTSLLILLALSAGVMSTPVAAQTGSISNIINSKPGISYNANARTIVTSTYLVQPEDHTILVNATTAAVTITLPPVSSKAYPYVVIKKIDSTANTVTIDPPGAGTIDGVTTLVLRNQYSTALLHADATEWRWVNASTTAHGVLALTAASPTVFNPDQTTSILTLTPTGSVSINATTTNAVKGRTYVLKILTSGTSSFTQTFGTAFKTTGTLATGTTSAKTFIVTFIYDGTNFVEVSRTTAM